MVTIELYCLRIDNHKNKQPPFYFSKKNSVPNGVCGTLFFVASQGQ